MWPRDSIIGQFAPTALPRLYRSIRERHTFGSRLLHFDTARSCRRRHSSFFPIARTANAYTWLPDSAIVRPNAFKRRRGVRSDNHSHRGGTTMPLSSHALLSGVDGLAAKSADLLILIARVMLAWVFVGVAYGTITNFAGSLGYFTSLKLSAPLAWTWAALLGEILLSASLILGIGTRYAAILMIVFVVVATALAHRYWEFPAGPLQIGQYNNFLKNISIIGGALAIFVTGAGRYSLDRKLAK